MQAVAETSEYYLLAWRPTTTSSEQVQSLAWFHDFAEFDSTMTAGHVHVIVVARVYRRINKVPAHVDGIDHGAGSGGQFGGVVQFRERV